MPGIGITQRNLWTDQIATMREAVPGRVQRLFLASSSRTPLADVSRDRGRRGRRLEIILPAEMVLQRRLSVPIDARRDLIHAVGLLVRAETPFGPDELLIHAEQERSAPGDGRTSFVVRMVPRSALLDRLRGAGIAPRDILALRPQNAEKLDFAPILYPARRYTRMLPLVPLIAILLSLVTLGFQWRSGQEQEIALLEAEIGDVLAEVKKADTTVASAIASGAGAAAIRNTLASTPSAFNTLQLIRQLLPTTTEIVAIVLHGAERRLTLRSSDILKDAEALSAADWVAAIDGPIVNDPASGRETATIVIADRMRAGA